jgi:hypothetical protein
MIVFVSGHGFSRTAESKRMVQPLSERFGTGKFSFKTPQAARDLIIAFFGHG